MATRAEALAQNLRSIVGRERAKWAAELERLNARLSNITNEGQRLSERIKELEELIALADASDRIRIEPPDDDQGSPRPVSAT